MRNYISSVNDLDLDPFNFAGQVFSGKEFNRLFPYEYRKYVKKSMKHYDFQYKIGFNRDINKLTLNSCSAGGLYFTTKNKSYGYSNWGERLFRVKIPDTAEVFIEDGKMKASEIILEEMLFDKEV